MESIDLYTEDNIAEGVWIELHELKERIDCYRCKVI